MHVVDASVWVSRFVSGDEHYVVSRTWLTSVIEREDILASPVLLLPEVAGAIARRTNSAEWAVKAVSLLQELPNARIVSLDGALAEKATSLAAELHLRGADAVYLALAHQLNIPLISWDNEQLIRGGRLVAVLTPGQALRS